MEGRAEKGDAGRGHGYHGAVDRRIGDRKRSRRAVHSSGVRTEDRSVGRTQLRSAARAAARIGAVRLRTRRVHGRAAVKARTDRDRKSTRLNSSHQIISYAVFCLKKKKKKKTKTMSP